MFAIFIVFLALGYTAGVDIVINSKFSYEKLPISCNDYFVPYDPCYGYYSTNAAQYSELCDRMKEVLLCWSDMLVRKCGFTLRAARLTLRRLVTFTVTLYNDNGEVSEKDVCAEELRLKYPIATITTELKVTTELKPPCLDRPAVKNGDCKDNAYLVGADWTGSCNCSIGFQRNPSAAVRCVLDKHGAYTWFEEVPMCNGAKRHGYNAGFVATAFLFLYYVYF
ncbi:hypothetical protein Ddc_23014 [Ditylenchus destructor]|nr:hypothetical protein Ddc_23014 [Ditylenchus destructor]